MRGGGGARYVTKGKVIFVYLTNMQVFYNKKKKKTLKNKSSFAVLFLGGEGKRSPKSECFLKINSIPTKYWFSV